jgi:hypothetical protein
MRPFSLARVVVATAVAGGLILPAAVAAAAPVSTPASEAQRDRVRWRALSDPRWEVRSTASAALTSKAGTAITDFLVTGLSAAERRAVTFERNNIAEITHALRTSTSTSVVHEASERALRATHDEKEDFVRFGLAEAKRLDAEGVKQHDDVVAAQAAADRAYVAELARTDPGAQVRSAASFAANSGRDEDLAEFFAYYWAAAARLDDEAYRMKLAGLDVRGNAALERARKAVLAAQAAEKGASGEAAAKLHAQTLAAWAAVADSAGGTSVDWAAERDRASHEAEAWGRVAAYATGATTEQDWAGVLARAENSRAAWTAAVAKATKEAADWKVLADQARLRANDQETDQ